ncbi:unnamed protein product [Pylaiella littoralis]
MQSYRAAVAQDADFADGIPEAIAWLGFSTRRNPFFLPPKGSAAADANVKPIRDIGIESGDSSGDVVARLRDAQDFILLDKKTDSPSAASEPAGNGLGGVPARIDLGGGSTLGGPPLPNGDGDGGGGGGGGGGPRRHTTRDRIRVMNNQLACAHDRIGELESSLRALEAERDGDSERAARVREAAEGAGRRKLTQKMYRLRGDAAVLEEGLEELDGEITAVRVRLFAERLDVARKRMLKDAFTAELSAKARARRRRAKKRNQSPNNRFSGNMSAQTNMHDEGDDDDDDDDKRHRQQDTSVAMVQARVRGIQARRPAGKSLEARTITPGRGERPQRHTSSPDEAAAAVRIGAAARGRLVRKRVAERTTRGISGPPSDVAAWSESAAGDRKQKSGTQVLTFAPGTPTAAPAGSSAFGDKLAQLESLGVVGVWAFFDSLGLGACSDYLRRRQPGGRDGDSSSGGSIDGTKLSRIARAPNPDAELLAAGVSARLHRVKLLSALGVGVGAVVAPGVAGSAERAPPPPPPPQQQPQPQPPSVTRDENASSSGRDGAATPVVAMAALHMVRMLRRQQDLVAGALLSKAEIFNPKDYLRVGVVRCGGGDGGGGGATEAVQTGATDPSGGAFLAPSLMLPELENVLSAQMRLSRQV